VTDDFTFCTRCRTSVPLWFIENMHSEVDSIYHNDGGVFERGLRVDDGEIFGTSLGGFPSPPESICHACTNGWPWPTAVETEDAYVERLQAWREEQREERERQRVAALGPDPGADEHAAAMALLDSLAASVEGPLLGIRDSGTDEVRKNMAAQLRRWADIVDPDVRVRLAVPMSKRSDPTRSPPR